MRQIKKEINELTFDDALDRLVEIAQLGDRVSITDEWEINYIVKNLKKRYGLVWKQLGMPEVDRDYQSAFYRCPKCEKYGFQSIYESDLCTSCANIKRGI